MARTTTKLLPIIMDDDTHFMATVKVEEEPESTFITIMVKGEYARFAGSFITAPEPIALTFASIPVQTHRKE